MFCETSVQILSGLVTVNIYYTPGRSTTMPKSSDMYNIRRTADWTLTKSFERALNSAKYSLTRRSR
jgi:hypothetical protein